MTPVLAIYSLTIVTKCGLSAALPRGNTSALKIREKALGLEHPELAWSLNGLAGIYFEKRKFKKAESRFQRALAIQEKALGREHPEVALTLDGLAALRTGQGRRKEAADLFQRSLSIRIKAFGTEHQAVTGNRKALEALLRL